MNIYEAIADIMKKGYSIGKEKRNQQQGFMYRGIDDVMNTFQPLMAEAGIFVVPEVLEQTRETRKSTKDKDLIYSILKMRYTFYASDGTSVSAVVIGEGMDSADKASNKAMAIAMKYAMFQVFCIPTEEMSDPDAETHELKPQPKKDDPKKAETKKPQKPAEQKPAEQKPDIELPPPASDGYWHCNECGNVVNLVVGNDGNKIFPKDLVRMSMKRIGRCLCADCLKKATELKNAASGN